MSGHFGLAVYPDAEGGGSGVDGLIVLDDTHGADPAALARFVADFSQLAAAAPWRRFTLELNPVKWSAAGIVAVDGLILVQEP